VELNVYNLKIRTKIQFLFPVLFLIAVASFPEIRVGLKLLLLNYDGAKYIENEWRVKNTLEAILLEPENYTITGYTRRAFSPELKKTLSLYHSFYLVTSDDTSFFTLSFNPAEKKFKSEGVWAINTGTDMESYVDFQSRTNEWEVREIFVNGGINTEMTVRNILFKMENKINYYFNDHKNDIVGMENCNTALQNTLVWNNLGNVEMVEYYTAQPSITGLLTYIPVLRLKQAGGQ
jgi:hypothetical protein